MPDAARFLVLQIADGGIEQLAVGVGHVVNRGRETR